MANPFLSKKIIIPAVIFFGGLLIASGILVLANFTAAKLSIASQSFQWTQATGAGISVPACGSSSNTLSTCSGGSPSLTISWAWTVNAAHPQECNLVNVGIYKSGVQVQGYQRACNDNVTWTGGESGTAYTYNVYFVDVDGNPPIETKSGAFTTPFCTPVLVSSCSASPLTANIGEDVTWTATPVGGAAPTTPKQEWVGDTTEGGWAGPPGGDTAILARRFQAIKDYNLKVVSLDMAKEGTVTGTLWVTIESDSGGIPSGTVLPGGTSPTIAEGQVWNWSPTGWVQFYLNNTQIVAGTNYWIVLRGSLSGPGNKIIALDTLAADSNPGSLSLVHFWGAPAWTNTGASYGYRIYAPTYTYSWSGDAPLGGQTVNPATVQYPTDGPKSGSVTVSDGVTFASASCGTVTLNAQLPGDFHLNLGGSVSCNSVPLSWTASSGAVGYRIFRSSPRVDISPYQPYIALNFTDTAVSQDTDYKYQIEAYNGTGTNRSNVLNVDTPFCSPTLNFSGSPTSIFQGQSSTLTWDTTYTTSCTASSAPTQSDWSGSKALNGNQVVVPLPPPSVTYTMTCTGPGGSIGPQSVIINITPLGLPNWKEIIPR